MLQSEAPLDDLVESDGEPVFSPVVVISDVSDQNKTDSFVAQQ